MIFSFLPSFSSLLDLHVTIQATYLITTFFITSLSFCVVSYYEHEALKDTIYIILGSLALTVFCVYLFNASTILSAATVGILSGEVLGLLIHELSHTIRKKRKN
ncbi:MAG: hypothetical protein WC254_01030 [Candidatus Woesearchaeota archaeon]|jgi:hypothetical protein